MNEHETETGFGSGLRAKLVGESAPPVEAAAPGALDLLEELSAARLHEPPLPTAETVLHDDALRVELETVLDRERQLRESLQHQVEAYERELAAGREAAVREAALAQETSRLETAHSELEEQQFLLHIQLDQVEAERAALSTARAELVAEEARVTELASHVDARAAELASADSQRAQASAHLAQQLAGIAERERGLKEERAALDARREEVEQRLETRERQLRVRDAAVAECERLHDSRETALHAQATELEREQYRLKEATDVLGAREAALQRKLAARERMLENGESAIAAREKSLRDHEELLERERAGHGQASQDAFALLAELEQREARVREREAAAVERDERLTAFSREVDDREEEVRVREARLVADVELREDGLEERERTLAEREEMIGRRERDLAAYVRDLQGRFSARSVA